MKSLVLLVVLSLGTLFPYAQDSKLPWQFGMNIGANYTNIIAPQSLLDIGKVNNRTGFQLGIVSNYQATRIFSIAPKAEISFNQGKIAISDIEGNETQYEVLPISLDVMTHFVFKKPEGKTKPYFFAGPNLKMPISKKPKESNQFHHSYDFAIDFGIGIEKTFSKFNFSPELRYSYGLLNVNQNPRVQSLNFHQVSLVFNFMG